jgi:hypothetical protein
MRVAGTLAWLLFGIASCGGGAAAVRPDCPAGQTNFDGTCVSRQVADNSRSLSAAGGA